MQTVKIDQNSEEWLEFRKGKITGTKLKNLFPKSAPDRQILIDLLKDLGKEFSKPAPTKNDPEKRTLLTIAEMLEKLTTEEMSQLRSKQPKKDEFYKLVADLVARPINFNDYEAPDGVKVGWRERGHILEPEALAAFEALTGKKVQKDDVVWVSSENPNMMLSPDGPIEGEVVTEAVEVKCPDNHTVIRAWHEDTYPDEYQEQVLQYFIVNDELQTLYFVIFTDCIPSLPIQVFVIERADVADELEVYREFEKIVLVEVYELAGKLAF